MTTLIRIDSKSTSGTPLEVCEHRDLKGGYEPPETPTWFSGPRTAPATTAQLILDFIADDPE